MKGWPQFYIRLSNVGFLTGTPVGEKVKHVLTAQKTVGEGTYRTRVYLRNGSDLIAKGKNGRWVDAIDDLGAVRLR